MLDEHSQPSHLVDRFVEECLCHSKQRHPNIVQLIGVHFPDSDLPIPMIVMEYLPMTLTNCLEKYPCLPPSTERSILLDVATGLEYLHSQTPLIMHRDLTPNNVLLTSHMQAKISDLGQAKILDLSPARRQTTAPGNVCYMPPEALVSMPTYSAKIDVFSFGILILHVATHTWPFRQTVIDPKTHQEKSATEVEKRKKYFEMMYRENPLAALATMCLEDNPDKRPDSAKLVQEIGPTLLSTNTLEMQLALESELNKTQVLKKHIQDVDIQIKAIADEFNRNLLDESSSESALPPVALPPNQSTLADAYIQLQEISIANNTTLTNTGSHELIVAYKFPNNHCRNDLRLTLMRSYSTDSSAEGSMEVIVRAPLSIHFTGTHVRTIEGIKEPWGVAAGRQGEFFVVDSGGRSGVLLYSRGGEALGSFVPSLSRVNMSSPEGYCYYPRGIAVDRDGSFILVDTWCHRIQRFKLSSDRKEAEFKKAAGTTRGNEASEFSSPLGICINRANGDVYVCDKENHRIQVLDSQLQFKRSFGQEGDGLSDFRNPWDIDFDSKGNIYVVDCTHYVVKVFSQNWEYQGEIGGKGHGKGSFDYITSLCIDKHDYIYVTDKSWNCVQVFNPRREFVMQLQLPGVSGKWSSEPLGVAVDDDGFVYVSCKATGCVRIYK